MTTPEFCLDCRAVDPQYTKGGLTSKQLAELGHLRTVKARAEQAMLMRAAGRSNYEAGLARDRERKRAEKIRRAERRKAA